MKQCGFSGMMSDLVSDKRIHLEDEVIVVEPYEFLWFKN